MITCVDISADNAMWASGSLDETARIWNLDTGKLVAGPFKREDSVGAVRFSPDSKKEKACSQVVVGLVPGIRSLGCQAFRVISESGRSRGIVFAGIKPS
ncbi:hypothetical protein CY34DRAFT_103303 [Suillus luteus UH-Slu-Lm8-n1]|uniref:Uncharacterized protein n=1 Tax=Suillus luteus UH-Slu-Lm8-n1 TaxID=930992 RepID=A0A0C9ZQ76_9AGAM|nr:hypothetical protein CY34DRAFT_103303 [Suillus luteus UH-Slu-Lm8-n1]